MTQSKPQLRRDMKARRAAMSADQVATASAAICHKVLNLPGLREARSVFIYVSIRHEPDTRDLIRDLLALGKRVSVPRIDSTGLMHAHLIDCLDDLTPDGPDQFGIPSPPLIAPVESNPSLTLVPGLAFTQTGQRLGMGGGHYDRFLADHPDTAAIGMCYGWQIINDMPNEPHDQPVHMLVTEGRVISCPD
jgi:5-formyltetrahydrofolate cyclo-ligase